MRIVLPPRILSLPTVNCTRRKKKKKRKKTRIETGNILRFPFSNRIFKQDSVTIRVTFDIIISGSGTIEQAFSLWLETIILFFLFFLWEIKFKDSERENRGYLEDMILNKGSRKWGYHLSKVYRKKIEKSLAGRVENRWTGWDALSSDLTLSRGTSEIMARGGVGVEYRPKLTPIYDFEPARMKRSCALSFSFFSWRWRWFDYQFSRTILATKCRQVVIVSVIFERYLGK